MSVTVRSTSLYSSTWDCWGWGVQGSAGFSWQHNPAQTPPVCSKRPLPELAVPSGDILTTQCLLLTCWKWVPPLYSHWQKGSSCKLSPNLCPARSNCSAQIILPLKLVLFILASSNYQWPCLSLVFLFHFELETTISISIPLLSFPNIICNFSYLLQNPPCLQTLLPVLAHKHIHSAHPTHQLSQFSSTPSPKTLWRGKLQKFTSPALCHPRSSWAETAMKLSWGRKKERH